MQTNQTIQKALKREKKKVLASENRKAKVKTMKKVLKPKDKKAYKAIKAFSTLESWVENHHKAEFLYAAGLFDPRAILAPRVPNSLPIATAVASHKGLVTIPTNATGYLFAYLDPFANNVVVWNNGVGLSDTSSAPIASSAIPNLMSTANASRFKVVSAWLGCVDLTPALSRTGIISTGSIPYSQLVATTTSDTIRDSLWVSSTSMQEVTDYRGGFFIPMDVTGSTLYYLGARPNDYEVPVVFISAAAGTAQISFQYHINYEYVPNVGQTDLLAVSTGPVGSLEGSLMKASELRRERKAQHIESLPGFNSTLLSRLDLGNIYQGVKAAGSLALNAMKFII